MHASKSNPFRVLLVFIGFSLIAAAGLWFTGGRPTEISIEVRSSLSPVVLAQRFEEKVSLLPELTDSQTSSATSRRIPLHGSLVAPISGLGMIGLRGIVTAPMILPIADVVYSSEPTGSGIIDPAIVFTDTKFFYSDAMELEWYGRDDQYIYLREFDAKDHIRLVKLDPALVKFVAESADGTDGCVVRYVITMQHTGWKRFYGKLYSRSCEESARVRLAWICQQLESNE